MDLSRLDAIFDSEGIPLMRTDFGDDRAWEQVAALVTAPVDFGFDFDDDDPDDEGYVPNIALLDDAVFAGVTPDQLADSFSPSEDSFGYVLLADTRSMAEARAGGEVTVALVDLSVWPDEDSPEDGGDSWVGRTFRCVTSEIASVESNLSISNLGFADFADACGEDGVFRGSFGEEGRQPIVLPEVEPGLAASVRIGRDVDRAAEARELSGAVGSIEVSRTVRGARRRLFLICAHVTSWSNHVVRESSWTWSGFPTEEPGSLQWAQSYDHADQLTGRHGAVQYSFIEVDRPRRAVRRWQWLRHPSPGTPYIGYERWLPVLAEDSIVTLELDESVDDEGEPRTEIRIRHDGLPIEWLRDMQAWWDLQLAIADHADFGAPKR